MKHLLSTMCLCAFAMMNVNADDAAACAKTALEKVTPNTITYPADNGWLYSKNELEHLSGGELAGGKILARSKAQKKANANPIPAIEAFHRELKAAGIKLILVPVPPKAAVEPFPGLKKGDAMMYLTPFYQELRDRGIGIMDLYSAFAESAEPVYCRQDAHWNPNGIRIAAEKLAEAIGIAPGETVFEKKDEKIRIAGDLMLSLDRNAAPSEEITITRYSGKLFDESSPILLIGDSHTLVFSAGGDMLAKNAGLAECLAANLKMPIDRIAVKGSASTAVRINLYRKAAKNEAWMKKKKVVIWCFTCREFTESSSGWMIVPVFKKK